MPTTELEVSEIFESLQGEGVSSGQPCVFLRLAVCNLRCSWCDTKYSWDFKNYDYDTEVQLRSVDDVRAELEAKRHRRLVVTGGEPLLQAEALSNLLATLTGWSVEVETNGTVVPPEALAGHVAQWNVSPKLENSGEPSGRRIKLDALFALRELDNSWLKLVVRDGTCAAEAEQLLDETQWPRERVIWMPEATTRAELDRRSAHVAELCDKHAVRFSSRLQLSLWDGKRGA